MWLYKLALYFLNANKYLIHHVRVLTVKLNAINATYLDINRIKTYFQYECSRKIMEGDKK